MKYIYIKKYFKEVQKSVLLARTAEYELGFVSTCDYILRFGEYNILKAQRQLHYYYYR